MRDLAERMSCEPSNATFIVDKLEKRGLVERHAHPQDRRAKHLVLTAEGVELRGRLLELLTGHVGAPRMRDEPPRVLQLRRARPLDGPVPPRHPAAYDVLRRSG
ncbi:MarR family transcriptional regulator [Nonomuraea dietziae]